MFDYKIVESKLLELGITAFRQQGIDTSNADIEYVE